MRRAWNVVFLALLALAALGCAPQRTLALREWAVTATARGAVTLARRAT